MNENIIVKNVNINKNFIEKIYNQIPYIFWIYGLSGTGKSTLSSLLYNELLKNNYKVVLLDADFIRTTLNSDLGFTKNDRFENIRRLSELAKILYENGLIVIVNAITPYKQLRELVFNILNDTKFSFIYLHSSLQDLIERDEKGLYKKALNGKIKNFTAINDNFDFPENNEYDLYINTSKNDIDKSFGILFDFIMTKLKRRA